eukprot:PLAT12464.2.p1 GENE.PLAT12464.2~~PLAT12464.2.p1  ORF type:complete len:1079 (+),score=484.30 PLAT12464.2:35-3271(+)
MYAASSASSTWSASSSERTTHYSSIATASAGLTADSGGIDDGWFQLEEQIDSLSSKLTTLVSEIRSRNSDLEVFVRDPSSSSAIASLARSRSKHPPPRAWERDTPTPQPVIPPRRLVLSGDGSEGGEAEDEEKMAARSARGTAAHAAPPAPPLHFETGEMVIMGSAVRRNTTIESKLAAAPLKETLLQFKEAAVAADGALTEESFLSTISTVTGEELDASSEEEGRSVFARFDRDGNGLVDLDELAAALSVLSPAPHDERLRALFALYDDNGDGFIDASELQTYFLRVFSVMRSAKTTSQLRPVALAASAGMMRDADSNADGRLSIAEFSAWYDAEKARAEVLAGDGDVDDDDDMSEFVDFDDDDDDSSADAAVEEEKGSTGETAGLMARLAAVHVSSAVSTLRQVAMMSADGCMDERMFLEGIEDCIGELSAAEVREAAALFAAVDSDGSGDVDLAELAAALSQLFSGSADDKLAATFSLYDSDGSGTIELDEMTRYMTSVFTAMRLSGQLSAEDDPAQLAAATARSCLADADADGDGCVTLDEFQAWVARTTVGDEHGHADDEEPHGKAAKKSSSGSSGSGGSGSLSVDASTELFTPSPPPKASSSAFPHARQQAPTHVGSMMDGFELPGSDEEEDEEEDEQQAEEAEEKEEKEAEVKEEEAVESAVKAAETADSAVAGDGASSELDFDAIPLPPVAPPPVPVADPEVDHVEHADDPWQSSSLQRLNGLLQAIESRLNARQKLVHSALSTLTAHEMAGASAAAAAAAVPRASRRLTPTRVIRSQVVQRCRKALGQPVAAESEAELHRSLVTDPTLLDAGAIAGEQSEQSEQSDEGGTVADEEAETAEPGDDDVEGGDDHHDGEDDGDADADGDDDGDDGDDDDDDDSLFASDADDEDEEDSDQGFRLIDAETGEAYYARAEPVEADDDDSDSVHEEETYGSLGRAIRMSMDGADLMTYLDTGKLPPHLAAEMADVVEESDGESDGLSDEQNDGKLKKKPADAGDADDAEEEDDEEGEEDDDTFSVGSDDDLRAKPMAAPAPASSSRRSSVQADYYGAPRKSSGLWGRLRSALRTSR